MIKLLLVISILGFTAQEKQPEDRIPANPLVDFSSKRNEPTPAGVTKELVLDVLRQDKFPPVFNEAPEAQDTLESILRDPIPGFPLKGQIPLEEAIFGRRRRNTHDPRMPPTVMNDHAEIREINLRAILLTAVKNNRLIQIQSLTPEQIALEIQRQCAMFDSQYLAGTKYGVSDTQLLSVVDVAGSGDNRQNLTTFGSSAGQPHQLGWVKPLRNGATLSSYFSTGFTDQDPSGNFLALNPSWKSDIQVRYDQPIFQGAGREITETPIVIAKANWDRSVFEFEASVNRLFLDVELAYWDLAIASSELGVQQTAVTATKKAYEKEIQKLKLGESSRPEVGIARENYQRTRVAFLRSRSKVLSRELELRRLMGEDGFDGSRFTIPEKAGSPVVSLDWEAALSNLYFHRPEFDGQKAQLRISYSKLQLAKNGMRPDIDLTATYGQPGLAGNFSDSVEEMLSGDQYYWTLGILLNRTAGNRIPQANCREAEIEYNKQLLLMENIEYELVIKLQDAYQNLINALEQTRQGLDLKEAAAERLAAAEESYELGELAIDLLLAARFAFTNAEIQERQSYFAMRKSIAAWNYAQGTLRSAHLNVSSEYEIKKNEMSEMQRNQSSNPDESAPENDPEDVSELGKYKRPPVLR